MFALSLSEIGLYSFALLLLFITPGPVWVALIARSLKSGFAGAWPLALGVALGDICWPALALLSLGQIVSLHGDIIFWLRYIAVAVFAGMGIGLYLAPVQPLQARKQADKRRGAGRVSGRADGDYRQSESDVVLYWHPARIF